MIRKGIINKISVVALLCATMPSLVWTTADANDVCSAGLGLPPFLNAGAAPNLLLLLDNSGSMLDMAYIDLATHTSPTNDDYQNQCYDKSYNASTTYAGNFESEMIYEWVPLITTWTPGQVTTHDNLYYDNGVIYRAECIDEITVGSGTCRSEGIATLTTDYGSATIDNDDQNVTWHPLFNIPDWKSDVDYNASSIDFVRYNRQLYYKSGSPTTGTKPDVITTPPATAAWEAVEHTWRGDNNYSASNIVSYKGMLYKSTGPLASTRNNDSIWEDVDGITGAPLWTRIDEGYFQETSDTDTTFLCVDSGGTKHSTTALDLCVNIDDSSTADDVSDDKFIAFAATGNFLNWATASKFDIQKHILTGGKYSDGFTDLAEDNRLVSETRGCSGSGFIKEIDLSNGKVLTLSTRGSVSDKYEDTVDDWIDTTDDITRLQILGVTTDGLASNIEACMVAIDKCAAGLGCQNQIDACLAPASNSVGDQQAALSISVNVCRDLLSEDKPWEPADVANLADTLVAKCEDIYTYADPDSLKVEDGAYACFGDYDAALDQRDRTGYIGRCWDDTAGAGTRLCHQPG